MKKEESKLWTLFLAFVVVMAACTASVAPVEVSRVVEPAIPITPSPIAPAANHGCSDSVITPEDVRCYLAAADPSQVQRIDAETAVFFAEPQAIADWAGAAIIYHIPTSSTLVLDRFGDVDPQGSIFGDRAGLAALSEVAGDAELMAGLKQQVQIKWQIASSNEPEIRLSTAWQDGSTTIFLVAIAGLEATDGRFYCPGQSWTIGEDTEEIVADCMAYEAGTPVSHLFFEAKSIEGSNERPVQVALDGVPSNVVQVSEGTVSQETLVYRTVLQQQTNRPLIVRDETAGGLDEDSDQLLAGVDPMLLQNFAAANETPHSLRFLFQGSSAYFVTPNAAITRDYLQDGELQQVCARFRSDYPELGGVVTLSRIGLSNDGSQALVHMLHECGLADRQAAYYTLAETNDGWQITNTIAAATDSPSPAPQMDYINKVKGCGDIFLYKSNRTETEFIYVSVDAKALALSTAPVKLDLAAHPETIGARIEIYADRPEHDPYCNDVGPVEYPHSVWQAVSGTITASATSSIIAEIEPCTEPYRATVLLEDIVFVLGEETVYLPSLMFNDVQVGWCLD